MLGLSRGRGTGIPPTRALLLKDVEQHLASIGEAKLSHDALDDDATRESPGPNDAAQRRRLAPKLVA